MRAFADIVFYASFFIALCAGALAAETCLLLNYPLPWRLLGFIAASTLFIYNTHALMMAGTYSGLSPTPRQVWVRRHRTLLALVSAGSLGGALLLFEHYNMRMLLWLGHLAVLAIAYTLPFMPTRNSWIALRSVPLLKVFLIAYVWAAVTVQLPVMVQGHDWWSPLVRWLMLERLLFIFALALLFDIRDLFRDRTTDTLTLPGLLGQSVTKLLSIGTLLLFCGLVLWRHPQPQSLPLALSGVVAIAIVVLAHPGRSERFYTGWADGMMLLQALLVAAWGVALAGAV